MLKDNGINKKWKYKIGNDGDIDSGVFETEIVIDSTMKDGVRAKTLDGKNAYLQVIGEFGDDTHKSRFPKLMKHGTKLKIRVEVEKGDK